MAMFPRVYDLFMAPLERGRVGQYRHAVVSPVRGRALEVGAGTGLDYAHYEPVAWVVATDPDLGMLTRSRARARDASVTIVLVAADAQALPFRNEAFDDVVVGLAMCTIPQPIIALMEIRRVLAPEGVLRMLEHVRIDHPLVGRVQDWLTPVWRRIAGGCRLDRRTVETVRNAGFASVETTSHLGGYLQEIVARKMRPVVTVATQLESGASRV